MTKKKIYILHSTFYILLLLPLLVSAHVPGIPYWGQGGLLSCNTSTYPQPCNICELFHTFQHFVYFGITLVVFAFAPILIAWGGFLILTAGGSPAEILEGKKGNPAGLSQGKKILTGAIVGLAIALGSFLIINTFLWALGNGTAGTTGQVGWPEIKCSPNLLPGPVSMGTSNTSSITPPPPPTAQPPTGTLSDSQARTELTNSGISIVSTGSCSDQNNSKCTSLQGAPASGVAALIKLNNDMRTATGNNLALSGGTEVGHDTHGTGKSIFDLQANTQTNQFISQRTGVAVPQVNHWYQDKFANNRYYFYESNPNHWHTCLNTSDCPQVVGKD